MTDAANNAVLQAERTTADYTYTLSGQRAKVVQSGGTVRTVRYAYDTLGRLSVKDTPEGTLTYTYDDASGAVTKISSRTNYSGWPAQPPYAFESLTGSLSNPNGVESAYAYDQLGRLSKVNPDSDAPEAPADASYGYDALGNLGTLGYRNNLVTSYTYNERNWLRMVEAKLGTVTVARFDYDGAGPDGATWADGRHLSPVGQRRRVAELLSGNSRVVDYDYDALSRLTKETVSGSSADFLIDYSVQTPGSVTEGYDRVGNRRSRTVSADPSVKSALANAGLDTFTGHQFDARDLLHVDGATGLNPQYDPNGNTVNYTPVSGSQQPISYSYDAENRLLKKTGNGPDVYITYDAEGNRVKKVVDSVVTTYLVDDRNPTGYAQVVEERDSSGSPTVLYTYGLSLISQKRGGSVSYYGCDGQGSVRHLTSGTTGAITDTYTYDAFGIQIASWSLNAQQPTLNSYLYCGEQYDPDLAFYYLRARYYKPDTGRFWTRDTLEGLNDDPQSLHRYSYCAADPINGIDPTGHFSNWFYGREVHAALGADFIGRPERCGPRYYGQPISVLLDVPWRPTLTASQPDLVEIPTSSGDCIVYEIKPVGSYVEGRTQLQYYLSVLNGSDLEGRHWREGTAGEYTPPPRIWLSGLNFAAVQPPVNGVILYDVQGVNLKHLLILALMTSRVEMAEVQGQVLEATALDVEARVAL